MSLPSDRAKSLGPLAMDDWALSEGRPHIRSLLCSDRGSWPPLGCHFLAQIPGSALAESRRLRALAGGGSLGR